MKKHIFFIFLFLIFPLSVYANTMELNCNYLNESTKQVSCQINGKSSDTITEVSFHINILDILSIEKIITNDDWKIIANSNGDITLTSKGLTDNFIIGEIILNISNEVDNITFENIRYKNSNYEYIKLMNVIAPLQSITDNSLLKNIIIENYLINFKRNIYFYELKINNEANLNISVIPEYPDTQYQILNNSNLIDGTEIQIITKSQNNMSSTYTIKIKKDVVVDKQNYLYIFIGIVFFIVIINIIRLINRRKK